MAEHSPNTSEYSKPHESAAEPNTHVDQYSYGPDGKEDRSLRQDHITDPGAIEMGQETYKWHRSQRDDDPDPDSGGGSSGK